MAKPLKSAADLTPAPPAAATAPVPTEAPAPPIVCEVAADCRVTTRDVYAAQALSAIVCGIVTRGGMDALEFALEGDAISTMVSRIVDKMMVARDA